MSEKHGLFAVDRVDDINALLKKGLPSTDYSGVPGFLHPPS